MVFQLMFLMQLHNFRAATELHINKYFSNQQSYSEIKTKQVKDYYFKLIVENKIEKCLFLTLTKINDYKKSYKTKTKKKRNLIRVFIIKFDHFNYLFFKEKLIFIQVYVCFYFIFYQKLS